VQGVEGHPGGLTGTQPVEQVDRECAQVSRADGRLTAGQLRGELRTAVANRTIAGLGAEQRTGRKVVSGEMSAQLVVGCLPPSERLRGARQAGRQAEHMQQSVDVEPHQMAAIDLERRECRARAQTYRREREGPHADALDPIRRVYAECQHGT
jgi:hypothetical protein